MRPTFERRPATVSSRRRSYRNTQLRVQTDAGGSPRMLSASDPGKPYQLLATPRPPVSRPATAANSTGPGFVAAEKKPPPRKCSSQSELGSSIHSVNEGNVLDSKAEDIELAGVEARGLSSAIRNPAKPSTPSIPLTPRPLTSSPRPLPQSTQQLFKSPRAQSDPGIAPQNIKTGITQPASASHSAIEARVPVVRLENLFPSLWRAE